MKDTVRTAVSLVVGFIVFWYAGAMADFFPFLADDLAVRAAGFTGLLVVIAVVLCACWIIETLKKNGK